MDVRSLAAGWRLLTLAAEAPDRIPGWDAVVLTASGPAQADLYRHQLGRLARRGRLPARTRCLVVEDPGGARIGSGGATLNALRRLVHELGGATEVGRSRVLLVHAGGDSRRLPWASVVGKAFVPVPWCADPDRPCPTLLEHLLALASGMPAALPEGGMLCLSGDVLPLADLAAWAWPRDGLAAAAVPAPLGLAGRHGAFAADGDGRITALLQKADPATLAAHGAVLPGGMALLDTGVWTIAGGALAALAGFAAEGDPVGCLLADGRELSLYEEIPAACLAARHGWLAGRPLGPDLARVLGGRGLHAVRTDGLRFLHLGTGGEYLEHLARAGGPARLLADTGPGAHPDALVIESRLGHGTRLGAGSVVAYSRLSDRALVGRRCVVQGVDAHDEPLVLPDHHALWQVPVPGPGGPLWVTAWCGVDDNPKAPIAEATFGNRRLSSWMEERGVAAADLWPDGGERTLWTARAFPVSGPSPSVAAIGWMTGDPAAHPAGGAAWRGAERRSLAQLAGGFAAEAVIRARQHVADRVALAALGPVAAQGLDRDAAALAGALSDGARPALASLADGIPAEAPIAPHRRHWLRADLLAAAGSPGAAASREAAWSAVAAAVGGSLDIPACAPASASVGAAEAVLPARIDLAGGWTDTPPICLEQPARVLNLAVRIDGERPIGARAEIDPRPGLHLRLDQGPSVHRAWADLPADGRFPLADPHALLATAAVVCGWGGGGIDPSSGLAIHAWSRLPRGSGLGGSSILAAAVVTALLRLAGRAADAATVSGLVLTVEQRLSTGGGWQDQLGGLVPGAKLLASQPVAPLRIGIEPVPVADGVRAELERRLVLVDTRITRLARDVLQRVVGGYLARHHPVMRGIARLADLAVEGRDALGAGRLDDLGRVMAEVWAIHQTLDPHCSHPAVDRLVAGVAGDLSGWKLTGAGGGGFAILLARDAAAARRVATAVTAAGARPVPWSLDDGA